MTQTPKKICDKKLKTIESKMLKILNKIHTCNLSDAYVSKISLFRNESRLNKIKDFLFGVRVRYIIGFVLFLVGSVLWGYAQFTTKSCLVRIPSSWRAAFRPPEPCDACANVHGIVRVTNITAHEFERLYAYGAQPVIVADAAKHWKALTHFNYEFFKEFYSTGKMGKQVNDCFYFAYKSGLNSLEEVFTMDPGRANLSGEPWYVGWSTCYDEETKFLRSYYERPYFLPVTAESEMVDWIFMGGPGQGAHMHVDSVRHMSWQAQVRGKKQWQLAAAPECLYQCHWFHFQVEPGEILVVDTNRWYHRTSVLPGDISITIGAEYD